MLTASLQKNKIPQKAPRYDSKLSGSEDPILEF